MCSDKKKEFEEIELMTKEDAIKEIKKFFKGNRKFIELSTFLVNSSRNFKKLNSINYRTDDWNWEKYLYISIDTDLGFKQLFYRKGNKKYAPTAERKVGNKTYDINEFSLVVYNMKTQKSEEYSF